jgi:hypothetical protein
MGEREVTPEPVLRNQGESIKKTLMLLTGSIRASHSLSQAIKMKQAILLVFFASIQAILLSILVSTSSIGEETKETICNVLPSRDEGSITEECPAVGYTVVNGGVHVYVFQVSIDGYGDPVYMFFGYRKGVLVSVTRHLPVFV